jgi:hypothetical protein
MNGRFVRLAVAMMIVGMPAGAQPSHQWPQHSMDRPKPAVVDPGAGMLPVPPPKDARVLFDGTGLSKWAHADGKPASWIVRDGYFEVRPRSGMLVTRDSLGSDIQLHIEWVSPNPPTGTGQNRGNSGVFLMSKYEVQVLDSYENATYADGQAGAVYGQYPPLVNASRPPGQWQSYDIVFHGPRFDSSGRLTRPATVTVLHNGILVQDNVTLEGPVGHHARPPYEAHPERLPLGLQDHGDLVRFRNIWVRELR